MTSKEGEEGKAIGAGVFKRDLFQQKYYEMSLVTVDLLLEAGFEETTESRYSRSFVKDGVMAHFSEMGLIPTGPHRHLCPFCLPCNRYIDVFDKRDEEKYWKNVKLLTLGGIRCPGHRCQRLSHLPGV